jgi:hypothetical protein
MSHGSDSQHVQQIVEKAFNEARQMDLQPSPYMRTRILAELRERKSLYLTVALWKRLAGGSIALVLGLLIWTSTKKATGFEAVVNQPYAVRVEMAELQTELIAGAEISLPDGVYFYSEAYPELKEKRSLDLAWNGSLSQSVLPFVINGSEKGKKDVKIKFFDNQRKVIAERTLNIEFMDKQI